MVIKRELQGLEKITEFLKVIFASGYIADDKPLSLLLVAPVSSGKTTAIKQFQKNKTVMITTDSTAFGILQKYAEKLRKGEIKHIILPDLLNALCRRKTTTETFLMFVNASSEDGIFPSKSYNVEISEFIQPFGWVLCVTEDGYKSKQKYLKSVGLLSRFFKVSHKYSADMISKILNDIIHEEKFLLPEITLKHRMKKVKIEGDVAIFKELETYSQLLCKQGDAEILRMQRKMQTFLKSCAYLREDKKVKKEDLEKLKGLLPLIQSD